MEGNHLNGAVLATLIILIGLLSLGTFSYHLVEGWRFVDAFYFTGASITTVGYGDITPKTDFGKVFSVVFNFAGIAVVLFAFGVIAHEYLEEKHKSLERKLQARLNRRIERIEHQEIRIPREKMSILDEILEKRRKRKHASHKHS